VGRRTFARDASVRFVSSGCAAAGLARFLRSALDIVAEKVSLRLLETASD
jgi:hypothetical protein